MNALSYAKNSRATEGSEPAKEKIGYSEEKNGFMEEKKGGFGEEKREGESELRTRYVSIENVRCNEHSDLPIQFFCLACQTHCFCGECAVRRHGQCDPLGLPESRARVESQFVRRWMADLVTRSETLRSSFRQVLLDRRDAYGLALQDLQGRLGALCSLVVAPALDAVKRNVMLHLAAHEEAVRRFCRSERAALQDSLGQLEELSKALRAHRTLSPAQLLLFYRANRDVLARLMLSDSSELVRLAPPEPAFSELLLSPPEVDVEGQVKQTGFKGLRRRIAGVQGLNGECHGRVRRAVSILNALQNDIRA